jgi:hypothetical protein
LEVMGLDTDQFIAHTYFHLLVVLFMTSISQSYLGWTSRPSLNHNPNANYPCT